MHPTTPTRSPRLLILAFTLLLAGASQAQSTAETAPTPAHGEGFHPWQVPTPRLKSEAYFTNLKDGDKIETPFVVKFGLSGNWGLAPVSKASDGKSGHHHLLVNRDLPLNFKSALPFNDQYIHFGKGQMESVLTFEPGTYTLRLLLANQQHLPFFVYSKPATITVTKKNPTDPKTMQKQGISMVVSEGQQVKAPFRVQFHASALNVAHRDQQVPDTGHFRLTVTPQGRGQPAVMNFVNGQTEVWLSPPSGGYSLQLEFLDNANGGKALVPPVSTALTVL